MHVAGPPVELEHASRQSIEEIAIVTDDDQGALVREQPLLEPGDPGEVEVVGGLVEDQQFAGSRERLGQRHPLGLSTRQGVDLLVQLWGDAEAVECGDGLPAIPDRRADGAPLEMGTLLQELDSHASATVNRPFVRFETPGDDAKQGGLAGAIDTDDAESIAIGDRDRQVLEKWSVGLVKGNALKIYEHAHLLKFTVARPLGNPGLGTGVSATFASPTRSPSTLQQSTVTPCISFEARR